MENYFARRVNEFTVRLASPEDVPKVISVNWATLPEHYSDSFFEELLRESPETFLVGELGNELVGYIMCRIEYGFSTTKRFGLARKGHIVSLAVLPVHRRRGLGKALVQDAIEGMVRRSCSEVYLEVRASNDAAIKLYETLGFRSSSRIPGYYRDGEAAQMMSLQLLPRAS